MGLGRYGPFANVVVIASALVATFSVFLLKSFGRVRRWTWLTTGAPPFVVTAAARALAVALMAFTYVTISKENYRWFAGSAIVSGLLTFVSIAWFERLRTLYVAQISLVGKDGKQLFRGKTPLYENVVIGRESELRDQAKADLEKARRKSGGLSVLEFMRGYGATRLNDPEALWDAALLAGRRSALSITLMVTFLLGVMALFWSAFIIDVTTNTTSP